MFCPIRQSLHILYLQWFSDWGSRTDDVFFSLFPDLFPRLPHASCTQCSTLREKSARYLQVSRYVFYFYTTGSMVFSSSFCSSLCSSVRPPFPPHVRPEVSVLRLYALFWFLKILSLTFLTTGRIGFLLLLKVSAIKFEICVSFALNCFALLVFLNVSLEIVDMWYYKWLDTSLLLMHSKVKVMYLLLLLLFIYFFYLFFFVFVNIWVKVCGFFFCLKFLVCSYM